MPITISNLGTRELWEQFSNDPVGFYRAVASDMETQGVTDSPTMSRALEYASPTQQSDGLDAFERLLQHAGLRTRTNFRAGYYASQTADFLKTRGGRALLHEFALRTWRAVAFANPQERAMLLSSDGTPGSWQRPYFDGPARWEQQVKPAIPLAELVAMTTPIDGALYRSMFLEYDATQLRLFRVGQGAELPVATVQTRDHTITLRKYGRRLRASYEQLRQIGRIDKFAWMIMQMALQNEADKVAAGLNIIVSGDGNTDTAAATHNLTTLDSAAVAGTLTLKGWLAFKMKFTNPYLITTALMTEAVALQLSLLNTGSANVPLSNANLANIGTGLTPINQTSDNVRFGWTSDAPALKIVGFDKRFALEQLVEVGSSIVETDRFIGNQTEELAISEVQGFAVLDPSAALILDVNA